jgi:hypothetical protein
LVFFQTTVISSKKSNNKRESFHYYSEEIYGDSEDDDVGLDPDWQKTPIFKRLQKLKHDRFPVRPENERGVKRNCDGHVSCTCKGVCKNKLCGCRRIECKCDQPARTKIR